MCAARWNFPKQCFVDLVHLFWNLCEHISSDLTVHCVQTRPHSYSQPSCLWLLPLCWYGTWLQAILGSPQLVNGLRTGETSLRRCVWRHMLWPLEYMTFYFTKWTSHCPSIKHLVLYHRWFEKLCPREGSCTSKSGPSVHSLICSLLPAGSPRVAFSWNQCFQLLLEHSYPASSCKK